MYILFKFHPNVYDDIVICNSVVALANHQIEVRQNVWRVGLPNGQKMFDEWMEIELVSFLMIKGRKTLN